MMKAVFVALAAALLVSQPSRAATITGRVVDAETGAPVAGARVVLRPEAGPFFSAISQANGSFARELPAGPYLMEVAAPSRTPYASSPAKVTVSEPQTAVGLVRLRDPRVTTLLLLRHADRANEPGDNPPLSPDGQVRAQDLARVARFSGITRIYRSQMQRSIQTAAPLAAALGLAPLQYTYQGANVTALAQQLLALPRGSKSMVVAHSDSIGPLLAALGSSAGTCPLQGGNDYDNLCVVSRASGQITRVLHLQYGAAPPP
jgi:phosphohistidine phosphatase SixA